MIRHEPFFIEIEGIGCVGYKTQFLQGINHAGTAPEAGRAEGADIILPQRLAHPVGCHTDAVLAFFRQHGLDARDGKQFVTNRFVIEGMAAYFVTGPVYLAHNGRPVTGGIAREEKGGRYTMLVEHIQNTWCTMNQSLIKGGPTANVRFHVEAEDNLGMIHEGAP